MHSEQIQPVFPFIVKQLFKTYFWFWILLLFKKVMLFFLFGKKVFSCGFKGFSFSIFGSSILFGFSLFGEEFWILWQKELINGGSNRIEGNILLSFLYPSSFWLSFFSSTFSLSFLLKGNSKIGCCFSFEGKSSLFKFSFNLK